MTDGSGVFVSKIGPPRKNPVHWNPWNLVVQNHHTGEIDIELTNKERAARGLPVPQTPEMCSKECGKFVR